MVASPRNRPSAGVGRIRPVVDRDQPAGQLVHRYEIPAKLLPRDAATASSTTPAKRQHAGKRTTAASRAWRSAPTAAPSTRCCRARCSTKAAATASQPHRRLRHAHGASGGAVRLPMEGSSQGRGISALVALNDRVPRARAQQPRARRRAELAPANKKVFRIDLAGASDVSGSTWTAPGAASSPGGEGAARPGSTSRPRDAGASVAGRAGRRVARKVGRPDDRPAPEGRQLPRARRHRQRLLGDAERRHSVQFDVYFKPSGRRGRSRIQCDIGTFLNCTAGCGRRHGRARAVPAGLRLHGYRLSPACCTPTRRRRRPGPLVRPSIDRAAVR